MFLPINNSILRARNQFHKKKNQAKSPENYRKKKIETSRTGEN